MRIASFDTETTGIDLDKDEVVTASIVSVVDGKFDTKEWLLKTNIESNPSAYSKHLIDRETQLSDGLDYESTIIEIARTLVNDYDYIITANGTFDLTMVQNSFDRTNGEDYFDLSSISMIDIMVLDKYLDKYRRGSRKLMDLADHYRVNYEGIPHNSTFDAILTYGIYVMMLPQLEDMGHSVRDLPHLCEVEHRDQRRNLAEYFERVGKRATVTTGYPVNTGKIETGV